ncbi:Molybdenum cofactor guanylyltransferase [Paenibacillus plantiphilus]|uniref:Probable molybdenum cofactor guanylyltransferase n=1 Tax=Paenibacillus plantiphilus TaxID=2905650 RepID=A0ABM9BUX1_9BACL|nr:molybdenum cofactor guanylyltransferase [Paenibacillus plantiphilus]CAH1193620.1 Molybdenum cofactor guanylyltransferase [Paenibacillus plantiphilus]
MDGVSISGILLAGGRSSRMGEDKALLDRNGKPLLWHIAQEMAQLCGPLVIAVGDEARKARYRDAVGELADHMLFVSDVYPGSGPLAGLHASLSVLPEGYAFVLACDMPILSETLLRRMIAQTKLRPIAKPKTVCSKSEIVAACDQPDVITAPNQPFHALYHTRIADRLEQLLQNGEYRVMNMLAHMRVEAVPVEADEERAFQNLNTPEAYARFLGGG